MKSHGATRHLFAISDLHVEHSENRALVESLRPKSAEDWLIVAGDVASSLSACSWALSTLKATFQTIIWVPGNHELHSYGRRQDASELCGSHRYEALVEMCRTIGVITPEDPYPVWSANGGDVRVVVPLFLLYDYSFGGATAEARRAALKRAFSKGKVSNDEFVLYPDPYPSREDWCAARLTSTRQRLDRLDPGVSTILVNHFPLRQSDTGILAFPEIAQWCGTVWTSDWHTRFNAVAVIYGHLHYPRTSWRDGVRFEEVSLGYPREWRYRRSRNPLKLILAD